ncbi:MAG: class I SAM-dependent methyltransferase [Actinomycetota bacterium]
MPVGESQRRRKVMPPYSASADIYDRMVGCFAFDHWRENFELLEERFGFDLSVVADAACGTGIAASYLAERGAMVYASDLSPQMLAQAAAWRANGRIRYMLQDMRYLQVPVRASLVNCATDAMNHLLAEADVESALASFRAALRPGGYAVFDMNTPWQLREGSDPETWEFDVEGQHMRWLSSWDEKEMIHTLTIVFTARGVGGLDVVEEHRERAFEVPWMLDALRRMGFTFAEAFDAAGLGGAVERTRRLVYVARA